MFFELFDGEIVYKKRFPLPDEIEELGEAAAAKKDTADTEAACESFEEYMRQADKKCVYVVRPDRVEFCQQFLEYAKNFSEQFEIGIDIINQKFSYVVKLYIGLALFRGRYKEMLDCLMIASDEVSFDRTDEENCEMTISLRCYTHDLYYNGRKKKLY